MCTPPNNRDTGVWAGREEILNQVKREKNSDWGGLNVRWEDEKVKEKKIHHVYQFTVNVATGDIYLDCTKGKLWCKCLTYSLIQPIILTAKTLYHIALPLSLPLRIYQEFQKIKAEELAEKVSLSNKEKSIRIVKTMGKHVADIVRTPLYGTAMTVVGLAGAVIGPLAPRSFLYDVRATAGKIERLLHRGEDNSWILFKCFQPLDNIQTIQNRDSKNKTSDMGLIHLGRALVWFRKNRRALFNDCMQKLPEDASYTSPYAREEDKKSKDHVAEIPHQGPEQ